MSHTGLSIGVAVLVVLSTIIFGASAFTSATVTRDANVNVVADDKAIIGLADGTSGSIVRKSSGRLNVDFAIGSSSGANSNATFKLGDSSDPTNKYGFAITNNASSQYTFTLDYSETSGDGNNLEFLVFNDTGSKLGEVNATSSGSLDITAASGETHYVVIVLDTGAGDGSLLGTSADLSGTFKVKV